MHSSGDTAGASSPEDRLAVRLFEKYGSVEKGKFRDYDQWVADANELRAFMGYQAPLEVRAASFEFVHRPENVEEAVASILKAHGLEGEHFEDTPRRFATMFATFNQPHDLEAILSTGFEESRDNVLVVQPNVPFKGLCAHHLLPFVGEAAVGYIAHGRIVGLSKLTRVVRAAGELRPSTQEDITHRIADAINSALHPLAVGVVSTATHGCMGVRGVEVPGVKTTVSALRGQFLLNPAARAEFLEMIRR